METELPELSETAMIYEDSKLYACLASHPIAKGHTVVVWKKKVADLHLLFRKDYEHLMDTVDEVRNALLSTLRVRKVYLIYMDEANQVHWHLIPRYNTIGYDIFKHKPGKLKDVLLAGKIRMNLGKR